MSVLLPEGDYYHQHLRSAQYFPFPRCPLSAFFWLLPSSAIDVGLHSTAPPRTVDLSLAIFCLPGLKHFFCCCFLRAFFVGFLVLQSWTAPVENETFTILLGCKSELCDLKQGMCSFHEINSQWIGGGKVSALHVHWNPKDKRAPTFQFRASELHHNLPIYKLALPELWHRNSINPPIPTHPPKIIKV